MEQKQSAPRYGPLIAAALFVALFIGVYVWRVQRSIPAIQAEKRAEACRRDLNDLYGYHRGYYGEHDAYVEDLSLIGWRPRDLRHALVSSRTGPFALHEPSPGDKGVLGALSETQVSAAIELAASRGAVPGVSGKCPSCEVVILCISQNDEDETLDVWSTSTEYRTHGGHTVPAGELMHVVDDANE